MNNGEQVHARMTRIEQHVDRHPAGRVMALVEIITDPEIPGHGSMTQEEVDELHAAHVRYALLDLDEREAVDAVRLAKSTSPYDYFDAGHWTDAINAVVGVRS